jgi:hypothetical protein
MLIKSLSLPNTDSEVCVVLQKKLVHNNYTIKLLLCQHAFKLRFEIISRLLLFLDFDSNRRGCIGRFCGRLWLSCRGDQHLF